MATSEMNNVKRQHVKSRGCQEICRVSALICNWETLKSPLGVLLKTTSAEGGPVKGNVLVSCYLENT